jgi:hypothetical protein
VPDADRSEIRTNRRPAVSNGTLVSEVLRAGAPSALALGVWTAVGGGCAATPAPVPTAQAVEPMPVETTQRPARVVFSDEPLHDDAVSGLPSEAAPGESSGGLVSALASSFADDQAALASMQADREAARQAPARVVFSDEPDPAPLQPTPVAGTVPESSEPIARTTPDGDAVAAPAPASTAVDAVPGPGPSTPPPAASGSAGIVATAGTSTASVDGPAGTATAAIPMSDPALGSVADGAPVAPVVSTPGANQALEIVEPAPTEPAPLARLLAESLVRSSAESVEPVREWIAYAALALTDPSIGLPAEFGQDLLPAEKTRVEAVHAAFVALGRALADGATELDRTSLDALVAALGGGPKLAIPRVELCTRVERFGQFTPLASRRFLARSNARFIAYCELDGFSSALESGRFVTRLASRISIETDRDGVEVWRRSPEWTAVVDTSDVRRDEFFVGEIVPLSEYLSVGSYRVKIELRDEATGATASSSVPFHVVADPAMVASGD